MVNMFDEYDELMENAFPQENYDYHKDITPEEMFKRGEITEKQYQDYLIAEYGPY